MVRKHVSALLALALVVASWSPSGFGQSLDAGRNEPVVAAGQDEVPDGLTASDWSSLRAAYEAGRHAAHPVEGGHRARNPGQQWTTLFDGRGFLTTPDAAGWTWGLELLRYGWGEAEQTVETPAIVIAEGQRVSYAWDDRLTEWYVNDGRGLEHGYTVHARPQGASGALTLELAVRGGLHPVVSSDGRDVRFLDAQGGAVLTYAGLVVRDADGRALVARWLATATGLRLRIDAGDACYPLSIDPVAQQAYLKASNAETGDVFGVSVSVSGDTVVVGAHLEDSSATGVNGDQGDDSATEAGAAYVFVRSGATWSQQAYLKASNTGANDRFGSAVSVSGDTVVVGAPFEDSSATGVNGNQSDNGAGEAGAAYVFVRSGTTWSQQAYLKASNTGSNDWFGLPVAVSGDTLVVGAPNEDSSATGVNGNQADNSAVASGAAYVFVRSGSTWSQQAYLKASNTEATDGFGAAAVSGDTVVVGAVTEDSSATGVNGNQGDNGASGSGAAYVFVRTGTTWSQQAYLKASNTEANDGFGAVTAVFDDTVVLGAPLEDSSATGVNGNQGDNGATDAGAAYVFVRSGTTWSQQAYLKASNPGPNDRFGTSVAVSGDTGVVGAVREDSSATGVNGDESDDSAADSGAAYLYLRNGTTWSQQAYLKASNTQTSDFFGATVAASGNTAVVGAVLEDNVAGAAYVFDLASTWRNLGGGTTGVAGPPLLTMSGPLVESTLLSLDLIAAAPSELAILFLSFSSSPAPFIGGTLHAFPIDDLVVLGTDGAGEIHGSIVFPPGVPSGTGLWFQFGIADGSVPIFGASLSNGVKGTVP